MNSRGPKPETQNPNPEAQNLKDPKRQTSASGHDPWDALHRLRQGYLRGRRRKGGKGLRACEGLVLGV